MSIIAIIPALDQNNYSPLGDLHNWGDTTLLEWKVSQLNLVDKIDKIVISTHSDKIKKVARKLDIEVFNRGQAMDLNEAVIHSCSKLNSDDHILWANPTFPFMDQHIFSAFINDYIEQNMPDDGSVTSRLIKEYLFNNNGPINFDNNDINVSRKDLKDIFMITNAAYIARFECIKERGRIFGINPKFFDTSWLASLEISQSQDIDMFSDLISKYFKEQF
jgi:CMP-N-acetylneuraminic acid synthetase